MLTNEEIQEINREISHYPYPAAACIDALKIVQQQRRWVSDESVKDIAQLLNMSNEEVDGVATFYSRIYRKPVGRNVILLCDGITCMVMGYETLYDFLKTRLGIGFGETTNDGRFTLLPISCLGDCDHAPAMMINNDHYNNLAMEKMDEMFAKYI